MVFLKLYQSKKTTVFIKEQKSTRRQFGISDHKKAAKRQIIDSRAHKKYLPQTVISTSAGDFFLTGTDRLLPIHATIQRHQVWQQRAGKQRKKSSKPTTGTQGTSLLFSYRFLRLQRIYLPINRITHPNFCQRAIRHRPQNPDPYNPDANRTAFCVKQPNNQKSLFVGTKSRGKGFYPFGITPHRRHDSFAAQGDYHLLCGELFVRRERKHILIFLPEHFINGFGNSVIQDDFIVPRILILAVKEAQNNRLSRIFLLNG